MRTPRFILPRGGAPTLELALPREVGTEDVIYLTVSQSGLPVLEYARNGTPSPAATGSLTLSDQNAQTLRLQMTQADTLRLEAGDCDLQLRIKSEGQAEVFPLLHGAVGPVRKQGEI